MRQPLTLDTWVRLTNGILPGALVEMPILGLGTYMTRKGRSTYRAVVHALHSGYRLIDTAKVYGNEKDVGDAIRDSKIPRDQLFITTKLWNLDHGYNSTIKACEESLESLGLDYLDLYLIHWPVKNLRLETWKAMEKLLSEQKCRAIGVSNYMIWHLEELMENADVIPAVNQVEFSPYLYQKELLEFCRKHGIRLEAYSPLTKGRKLNDPKLIAIARKYYKSPAQILIRWALQHDVVVIPKSSDTRRITENINVFNFSLSSEDMEALDNFNEDLRTSWDPSTFP